jgi:hypothetical protein
MDTKMAGDNQIKLTGIIQSEGEKQRGVFAMSGEAYRNYSENMASANEQIMQSFNQMTTNVVSSIGTLIGSIISGEGGFTQFMDNLLYAVADFLESFGKGLIAAAISMKAFQELLVKQPLLAVAAGVAAVAASVYVRNIADKGVAFADGGIVSGPTLGLVGEYANASTNPEVIAPLDKLKSIIGSPGDNTSGGYIAETRISGRDLAIILKREKEGATRG